MYGMNTVVSGAVDVPFASILERELRHMGFAVVQRAEHRSVDAHYAWLRSLASNGPEGYREPPVVTYSQQGYADNGALWASIGVRNIRELRWNLALTQAISAATGSLAMTYVSDRLRGAHGYGVYLGGSTIEAATRDIGAPDITMGVDAHIADERLMSPDDSLNRKHFSTLLEAFFGDERISRASTSWVLTPVADQPVIQRSSMQMRETLAWLVGLPDGRDNHTPSWLPSVAPWDPHVYDVYPEHDPGALDDDHQWIEVSPTGCLSLRSAANRSSDILEIAEQLGCAALVVEPDTDGVQLAFWSRTMGGRVQRAVGCGTTGLLEAWAPLGQLTGAPPAAVFRRVRS